MKGRPTAWGEELTALVTEGGPALVRVYAVEDPDDPGAVTRTSTGPIS